jgi:hypothetical protein
MLLHTCIIILAVFFLIPARPGYAENWLQGQVLENHGGAKKPAVGAQIWIVNVGNP